MLSKIFFIMKNVFVCKVCNFGKMVGTFLWKVLSGVVLLLFSAVIFCGFVTTALIATPVAVVEALLMVVWAFAFPVSATKCWKRWNERCGRRGMGDTIVFYINNYDFVWHYPVAKEAFMFLTSWVKSAKFRFNPYFVEETELYIWPAENQIRWYKQLHDGDAKALGRLSIYAFMMLWKQTNAEGKIELFKLMRGKLPEDALFELLEYRLQYDDVIDWRLVSEWFMCQCRSGKAVINLIIYALCGRDEKHQSAKIAEAVVLRNGLPQSVVADLLAKKDNNEVARRLIAANTNYEYIVMLKSSTNYNLSAILANCKKMNPEFEGFDSVVDMYLNESSYNTYHNCGYHLKLETVKKMLSSDNMSQPLFSEIVANEPMFKDLASLDEDVKILLQAKMKYFSKLS